MIFLVGPHGAGKTESAKILDLMGFVAIDLGPTLRSVHQRESPITSLGEWIVMGERATGTHFTDALLAEELKRLRVSVERDGSVDIVVVGNRSGGGVKYLETVVPPINGRNNRVVFIDAPFEMLRTRYNARENLQLTVEEFQAILDNDIALGIDSLRVRADITLLNDGSPSDLQLKIIQILHGFGY